MTALLLPPPLRKFLSTRNLSVCCGQLQVSPYHQRAIVWNSGLVQKKPLTFSLGLVVRVGWASSSNNHFYTNGDKEHNIMHAYILYQGLATPLTICFHLLHPPGTLQTTSTMIVSQSALDAEDSPPPIPPKLFLDDEFDNDLPPPIPPKLFLDDEFEDDPPPPIPPKLFLDDEFDDDPPPQQTGKNPSSHWQ